VYLDNNIHKHTTNSTNLKFKATTLSIPGDTALDEKKRHS